MNLNERIEILKKQKTKKPNGEVTYDYQSYEEIWAEVIPLSGKESLEGNKKQSEQKFRIRVRYRTDINVEDQIKWRGFVIDVRSSVPYMKAGRNRLTEITGRQIK